jgi:hypothetical protein
MEDFNIETYALKFKGMEYKDEIAAIKADTFEVTCACGTVFERPKMFIVWANKQFIGASSLYKRKLVCCDPCVRKQTEEMLKGLPTVLNALAKDDNG